MKKLSFALIGRGKFGKNYERLLSEMPETSLKAVVTKSSGNLKDVLGDPDIDCVAIVTPAITHFTLAKAALKAGKNILLEKPMVTNLKDAEKLKKMAANYDKVFMIGFQYLSNNYIQYLKKEIEENAFGKITNIKFEHFQSNPREDVNVFWDVAPHPLSIFQFIFNPKKIIKISGEQKKLGGSTMANYAHAIIQFDCGPTLDITASWPGKEKIRKLTIRGEKATAILDETKIAEKLILISNKDEKVTIPKIIAEEPLKNKIKDFLECIQNKKNPLTDINFGYLNTRWLEEINQKIAS